MKRRLVIRTEAQREIDEAVAWYAKRDHELAWEFLQLVGEHVEEIRRNPFLYPVSVPPSRKAVLLRFPYSLIYTVSDDEIVLIACFHDRRSPKHWRRRL